MLCLLALSFAWRIAVAINPSAVSTVPKLLFIASREDEQYFQKFASLISGSKVPLFTGEITVASEVTIAAKRMNATAIITTREDYLKKLLPPGREKKAKISNYAGSLIQTSEPGLDVLVLNPLAQLYSVPYGEWLTKRFLSKVISPERWRKTSEFNWSILRSEREYVDAGKYLDDCFLVSIDIETAPPNTIRCISYCGFRTDGTSHAFVFKMDSLEKVNWMRRLNASRVPKVCQNGKYEAAHFFAWSAPMVNYIADTKNAMHAWMAELPKNLAFLTSLLVRDTMYWKDLGDTGEELDLFKYNALDTWGTGEAFLSWLAEAPEWAMQNYVKKFRVVPAFHSYEMRGIKRDLPLLNKFAKAGFDDLDKQLSSIQRTVGIPGFNPSSPIQVKTLLFILGHGEKDKTTGKLGLPASSDEKTIAAAMLKHPLSEHILGKILEYRGERKLLTTYLTTGVDSKEYRGRVVYSVNPDGTDTGRAASKEHHFWTGVNIQNIPASKSGERVKQTYIADDGYVLFEIDKSQAEARGVAYCSGDEALLTAVNSGKDFHSVNAASFFGVPYESIYRDGVSEYWDDTLQRIVEATDGETLDKALRDLAKRVNHGANYNMGPAVLLTTMGELNVRKAQRLLKLNAGWSLIEVCKFLLHRYEITYPLVKTLYYSRIIESVMNTKKLVGPTGWTRYCFGNPVKNKLDLNSYVAHVTQSLNAMDLDECSVRVFNWQREENNWDDIQIFTQIHDSLLGQVRIGKEHLIKQVAKLMVYPIDVTCSRGITRQMAVPVEHKITGHRWGGPIDAERITA